MEKSELARQIAGMLDDTEWSRLEDGTQEAPVSSYNREVLLRVRERADEYTGKADAGLADRILTEVSAYLEVYWPEEPDAHKYVAAACLALRLLEDRPMHPPESVRYLAVVKDGRAEYYCPAREDGPVCRLCLGRDIGPLREAWEQRIKKTEDEHGPGSALVQREILTAGFSESGVIPTDELVFREEVRRCCEENRCGSYGTTWACPPAVGTLDECRERVGRYGKLQLFSRAYLLEDSMDFDGMKRAMADFKRTVLLLRRKLRDAGPEAAVLSNESCGRCAPCTYPDAPCRFPEDLCHSLEGYGFNVSELAKQAGVRYMNGPSTVTFFGAVLYDESGS